jgi:hypothetical protein
MANKKKEDVESKESEPLEIGESEQVSDPDVSQEATSSDVQGKELGGRINQLGSIVGIGFDLVEAGINLGVIVANRLSNVVQEQTIGKVDRATQPYPETYGAPYQDPRGMEPPYNPSAQSMEAPPQISYVMNRLHLFPGYPVAVSFTINNDSPDSPKEIHLRVEGFIGEGQGAQLNGADFAIDPDSKTIAPLDFDKFTLVGSIPQDILPDTYGGWIIVSAEEELRIPVRLLVSASPQ